MRDADHDHIKEQIPAYALNALEAKDAATVRDHLVGCAYCQAELAAYESIVDALPMAAPEADPSPALKNRLLRRVVVSPVESTAADETRSSLWQRISEALQGLSTAPRWQPATLIVIIALVASNLLLWQQANQPEDYTPGWQEVPLTGSDIAPQASGLIYISVDGLNGTLIVENLLQLSPEQQYQLWLIQDGERTGGAVFSVDENGYRGIQIESAESLLDYSSFGITIEPAGGSPAPTGERVLGYNL
ncbi:MAG: anti-sigma factor [Candidatus Promineifilaceae bacterium]